MTKYWFLNGMWLLNTGDHQHRFDYTVYFIFFLIWCTVLCIFTTNSLINAKGYIFCFSALYKTSIKLTIFLWCNLFNNCISLKQKNILMLFPWKKIHKHAIHSQTYEPLSILVKSTLVETALIDLQKTCFLTQSLLRKMDFGHLQSNW